MKKDRILRIFCDAWDLLLDLPIPAALTPRTGTPKSQGAAILLAVPVVGFLCGVLPVIVFKITGLFLPGFGNAFLFAAGMTVLLLGKDSGRGLQLMAEFSSLLVRTKSPAEALAILKRRKLQEIQDPVSNLTFVLITGLSVFAFTMLGCFHARVWAVPVMLMGSTVQGSLFSLPDRSSGVPFLAVQEKDRNKLWILAGFLMLFPAIAQPLAALAAFGLAYVLAMAVRHLCENLYGGATAEIITLTGFTAEIITLLSGLILTR